MMKMKKYMVEIILVIILIVSAIVFIVNTNGDIGDSISKENDNHEKATLLNADTEDVAGKLYDISRYIDTGLFEEYFIGQRGDKVYFVDTLAYKNVNILEMNSEKVKDNIEVTDVTVAYEYDGEKIEDGYAFVIVDIKRTNEYENERVISVERVLGNWENYSDYTTCKDRYSPYREQYPEDCEKMDMVMNADNDTCTYVATDNQKAVNGISVKSGESISYRLIYKIPADNINSTLVLYRRLNKSNATNQDFAIRLFTE